jgi:thiol-disulfide isomerase/thioredoxin
MKNLLICSIVVLLQFNANAAAKRFHIVGKFANATTATTITIGKNTVQIYKDSFEMYGYVDNSEFAFMHTNNSLQWGLWLTNGEYSIVVEEWKSETKQQQKYYLRINTLKGPPEAQQYYEWAQYKAVLIKKAYNKQLSDDSVNYYYTQKIWEYAKKVKSDNLLNDALKGLPSDKYTAALMKKVDSIRNTKEYTKTIKAYQLLAKGKQIENFSIKKSNDSILQLYNIKAKYILLDFWGTWCGPCRLKHPYFVKLYEKYAAKGFEIISVALDTDKQKWLNAIAKDKMTWQNVTEFKTWNTSLAQKYGVNKVPFNIFLNEKYEIIATDVSIGVIEAFLKEL